MNARRVLLVTFVFVGVLSSATPPQAQNKAACDLIPLADISTVFGQEMFLRPRRGMGPEYCNYMNVGPFDRPKPGQQSVSLNITFLHQAAPEPESSGAGINQKTAQLRRLRILVVAHHEHASDALVANFGDPELL